VPGRAVTPGAPAAGAASLACSPAAVGFGVDGGGPPCVPDPAATPGAPAAVTPSLACSPTDWVGLAGFCFWMAVLGCTELPAAGPDVVPCCWAIAAGVRARTTVSTIPDIWRLVIIGSSSQHDSRHVLLEAELQVSPECGRVSCTAWVEQRHGSGAALRLTASEQTEAHQRLQGLSISSLPNRCVGRSARGHLSR